MRKFGILFMGLLLLSFMPDILAQDAVDRMELTVPKVDTSVIVIDGSMSESEWQSAAEVNLISNSGYEIFANAYGREGLAEPEFDELYGRLLWTKDTLYVFIRVDEFVNDTTDLFWLTDQDTWWGGDQLFVSLSNRLGRDLADDGVTYDGNVYAAPNGPYYFLILGDQVTLNGGYPTYIPEEYRGICEGDSQAVFMASDITRYATHIDQETGVWEVEMAIYNPNVAAQSSIGFNMGGSTGSSHAYELDGDAYGYYTWQPNIPNDPFGDPYGNGDPGFYNLNNSDYWAILNFEGDDEEVIRKEVDVPSVDASLMTIDGSMDESAWEDAAQVNLITNSGYEIFANAYGREGLAEPEFDELYGRLLWSKDTLYVFVRVDEFVNDTTDLFWSTDQDTWWGGDQLFVSLSNRLGRDLADDGVTYDGNVYTAPDGPYYFLILGDQVTLNGGYPTFVPEEYRKCSDDSDSTVAFMASDIARYATHIDQDAGVWEVEMAIYNPNVAAQSLIGFNMGGSTGSSYANETFGDAYGYYTWQPNIPNDPFGDPFGNGDPGWYNLNNSDYWAILNFVGDPTSVELENVSNNVPENFSLHQNYPNPFNPTTNIRFDVANSSNVTLRIYNVVGEVVATLVNGQQFSPGTYSVKWDASNLSSGVYFYRLEADGIVNSMKMMLLK